MASFVQLTVVLTSAAGLLEAGLVMSEIEFGTNAFALLFLLSVPMRIAWRGRHADADRLWWPVEKVLFVWAVKDVWVNRERGPNPIIELVKAQAFALAFRDPVKLFSTVRRVLRWSRWLKWFAPIWGAVMHGKDALGRWYYMYKQRVARCRKMRTLRQMRQLQSPAESEHAAVCRVQAAFRGMLARRHVSRCRAADRLEAKWAAARLMRIVRHKRAALQEAADRRPLLLRPDCRFILGWKLCCMLVVLVEVASLFVADEDGERLSGRETLAQLAQRLLWPAECAALGGVSPPPRNWKRLLGLARQPLATAPAPHCDAWHTEVDGLLSYALGVLNLLGASPLSLALRLLGLVVDIVAVLDTWIEYFIGELDPKTGVLRHKSLATRYLAPPHSLLFNVLTNPALPTMNRLFVRLLMHDNSNHFWRFVFMAQPLRQCAEEYLTPRIRRGMRRHAAFRKSVRSEGLLASLGMWETRAAPGDVSHLRVVRTAMTSREALSAESRFLREASKQGKATTAGRTFSFKSPSTVTTSTVHGPCTSPCSPARRKLIYAPVEVREA